MKVLNLSAGCECAGTLGIGYRGENDRTEVRFDFSAWAEEFGAPGAVELFVRRQGDTNAYPIALTIDGSEAVWTVSSVDTAVEGLGEAEFVWLLNGVVAKTAVWGTYVAPDIGQPTDEPPDPYESWMEALGEMAAGTLINAQRAETAQTGAEAAEAAAEAAQTGAEAAQTAAEAAQAAAESAQTGAQDAQTAAATATQKASAASSSASSARSSATSASSYSSTALAAASNAVSASTRALNAQHAAETAQGASEAAKSAAEESAGEATQSSAEAATSAGEAAQSATDAAQSATEAAESAADAATSASAAATSETGAEAAQAAAEAVLESIPADYTTLSNDVSGLKSAVNVICPYEEITDWTIGYGYNTTGSAGSVIDLEHPEQNDAVRCTYVACQPGDKFTYKGGSSSSYRPFAYLKSDGTLIRKATYTSYDSIVTTAPDDAAYVLFNRNKNVTTHVFRGYLAEKQDKLTFDAQPTEDSANPVTSGGVFDALTAVEGEIDTVRDTVEGEIDALGLTGTAEGIEIAAFDDALAKPLKSLSVSFSPKQEGSGTPSIDNLRPITGWTGMTIYHSGEDASDPDELAVDWGAIPYGFYGGKVTYSGNGTWTIQKIWDGMMTNADGALQKYGGTGVYNWSGNRSSNYAYFSANGSNTGVIEDSELCNMYKHGLPSGGVDQIVRVYRSSGNSRCLLRDTSIPGWTEATTNAGLAAAVKAYFAGLYAQGIQFQCVWKLTNPVEFQITTDELVALLGKNRYWASAGDSIRVEYAEVTTTAVDAIRAGTFSYTGKNVAIIGDSISTNGNWSASNPLGNVPEIIVQTEDVGVSLSAYVTYYDVGTTVGGHTITEEEVGTEITFTPVEGDVGKVVGKPLNNNAAATATWWEVAAATLGFNPIPVAWSGSSITSHEEDVTDGGHYIYKCSYSWHESQIRKCGIRVPGTMNRIAPDMVIIYRGTNDLTHSPYSRITDYLDGYPTSYPAEDTYDDSGTTRYDYAKGMRLLINKLRTAYPQTKIVLCTMNYFRRLGSSKWTTNGTDNWQKYNNMIRRIAAYEGCDLIDFAKDGLSWANAKYGYYNEGTSDSANWTHPNTKGHAVLGARALRDLLNINDKPVVD